jgi:hypothetical protein
LPNYLEELFPPNINDTNRYNLRNSQDFVTIARRTEIYSKSVIPSSIKLWNELDPNIRDSETLSLFKNKINKLFENRQVPTFFKIGERTQSVYHARLRNRCSSLNADLYYNHLRDSPRCDCGFEVENAEHFFFVCKRYQIERRDLFLATRVFHPLSAHKLLFGNENLTDEENGLIFLEVQKYIKRTKRFI